MQRSLCYVCFIFICYWDSVTDPKIRQSHEGAIREGSVKGNVKVFFRIGNSSQSVKVREVNVKGHVKLFEICDFVAIREGP